MKSPSRQVTEWVVASLRRVLVLASTLVSVLLATCWLATAISMSPRPAPAAPYTDATATAAVPALFLHYRVGNTGGVGVYIRRTPMLVDHIRAWNDGALMEQIGPDVEAEGIRFVNVRDPDGNVGYVPSPYLIPIPFVPIPEATAAE